jgi:hypothetical protein
MSTAIAAAMSEEYDTLPGKVDSATRLSYLLGLQRAIQIIEDEIGKGETIKKDVLTKQRRASDTREV